MTLAMGFLVILVSEHHCVLLEGHAIAQNPLSDKQKRTASGISTTTRHALSSTKIHCWLLQNSSTVTDHHDLRHTHARTADTELVNRLLLLLCLSYTLDQK